MSWRGCSVGRMAGQRQTGRRQAGSGRARNRARAPLNWVSQGQRFGRCKVRRRAERVSRPAREQKRRRRVLVVTSCSSRPMRVVQRARLCAITWAASQTPLAAKRPEGRWFSPTPYLRSRMAFSISAWRRWSASNSRVSPSRSGGGGHQGHHLVAGVGSAQPVAQVEVSVNQLGAVQDAGTGWVAGVAQHLPPGGGHRRRRRCGRDGRGSIYQVLLVPGWFCLSKTIIPVAQEHFLTPSPRRNTHLFGGLGLNKCQAKFTPDDES